VRSVLELAGRAAIWRMTPDPQPVGLPSLLVWTVVLAAVRVALQLAAAGPDPQFDPYGLNAIIAWLALEIVVAALLIKPPWRTTALAAMVALLVLAEFIIGAVSIGLSMPPPVTGADSFWLRRVLPIAIVAVESIWWMGAMVAVLLSFAERPYAALGRVAALWVGLIAVTAIIPHAPVFLARDYDARNANLWEYFFARQTPREAAASVADEAAAVEQSQRALLQAEADHLVPRKQGATSIYAIGVAGWADQDVFLKELDGGLAVMGALLPIRDRTLRLVNHRETSESTPLANQRNFAAAVHAVGAAMNKNDDVLLLLMTSHGTQSGFALRLPNEVTTELTPDEVAAALDKEGIKNRIVIVSACYAGIFMPPLATDDAIVLTASDAKNTSFGCAPERDWTYFGDAFFRQSLRRGWDLQQAFDNARVLISGWELMDHAPPSNPQGHFGAALSAKLAPFFALPASAKQ
jgi:hypothetical protein